MLHNKQNPYDRLYQEQNQYNRLYAGQTVADITGCKIDINQVKSTIDKSILASKWSSGN